MAPDFDRFATYAYDEAGNMLSISDVSESGTDTQCFRYDHLRRLTEAWAQGTRSCATTPSESAMGGPAPYWHSYTYDAVGNRLTETLHEEDTERTYTYPEPGQPQPHTVTSVVDEAPDVTSLEQYTYDEAGNTRTRQLGGDTQTLTWNAEGRLAEVEEADGSRTEYVYDADGQRLIGRTPTETTLYLGHTELTVAEGESTARATRYIDAGGGNTVVFGDDGTLTYLLADHLGTGQVAVDAYTLDVAHRRNLPFGGIRGPDPFFWAGTRGYVGGTTAPSTGLTHLGAREYDPALGRFVSVDPLMDLTDPQQIHGYAYANNNPVTFSDPTGLILDTCWNGGYSCNFDGRGNITGVKKNGVPGIVQALPTPRTDSQVSYASNQQGQTQRACARELCGSPGPVYASPRIPEPEPAPVVQDSSSWWEIGLDIAGDVTGYNDLKDCVGRDWVACGMLVASVATGGSGRGVILAARYADEAVDAARYVDDAASCARHSFLAGTDVLMADGSRRNIEDLEIGDAILATDPETGETKPHTITSTIITDSDKEFTKLTLRDAEGVNQTIVATSHHPFWNVTDETWTNASELTPGSVLRTPDGATITVAEVRTYRDAGRTYDLTVETVHAYYVFAEASPVLVHNCPSGGFLSRIFGRGGEPPQPAPNATVGDLRGIAHDNVDANGNWVPDSDKMHLLSGQTDESFMRSIFMPDDEARSYMTYHSDGHMMEGNHRMAELMSRAANPRSTISWETPIYIRGWGG
ncbi:polymorphic toxin-type HINT domain-containing protein [Streptomyces sp. NPDC127098]|uniref:polymorphic toxin-type HINT domain-containing protein n=1 Tax=Streptomyces sp. NPDC127098 TaxID=3347137 RepID=UPI00365402E0